MNWTMRQSGEVRATINATFHVPRALVLWLKETGLSEAKAMDFIREHLLRLADQWHTIAFEPQYKPGSGLSVIHVDEAKEAVDDGCIVYEGPSVVYL